MNVRRISDTAGFERLRGTWTALHDRAPCASVFTSWEWLYPWWKHYGAGHELAILVAEEDGEIAGILPAYVFHGRVLGGVPVRTLRFLGTGGDTAPDDLDAIVRLEDAEHVAKELARYAVHAAGSWDVLRFTDMPPDSPFRGAFARAAQAGRLACCGQGVSARISYLRLPATWDEYYNAQPRRYRYKIRKHRSQPGVSCELWNGAPPFDEAFDRLALLHRLRWAGRGPEHAFSSQSYLAFHREAMQAAHARGWLRLYCMWFQGAIIAMLYCYRFRETVFYFQGGFDPSHARLAPGRALMGFAVENAIGEGNRVFDMLRGQYEYKNEWAPERRETHYVEAYRQTAAGLAARLRHRWLPAAKRAVRRVQAAWHPRGPTLPPDLHA